MLVNKSLIQTEIFGIFPKEDREFVTFKTGVPGGPVSHLPNRTQKLKLTNNLSAAAAADDVDDDDDDDDEIGLKKWGDNHAYSGLMRRIRPIGPM